MREWRVLAETDSLAGLSHSLVENVIYYFCTLSYGIKTCLDLPIAVFSKQIRY
jgi:hypothetical protein